METIDYHELSLCIKNYVFEGNHVLYEIEVNYIDSQWTVHRRFSEFQSLYENLRIVNTAIPDLPSRTLFSIHKEDQIQKRVVNLNIFLALLSQRPDLITHPHTNTFLLWEVKTQSVPQTIQFFHVDSINDPRFAVSSCNIDPSGYIFVTMEEPSHLSHLGKVWSIVDAEKVGALVVWKTGPILRSSKVQELGFSSRIRTSVLFSSKNLVVIGTQKGQLLVFKYEELERTIGATPSIAPIYSEDSNDILKPDMLYEIGLDLQDKCRDSGRDRSLIDEPIQGSSTMFSLSLVSNVQQYHSKIVIAMDKKERVVISSPVIQQDGTVVLFENELPSMIMSCDIDGAVRVCHVAPEGELVLHAGCRLSRRLDTPKEYVSSCLLSVYPKTMQSGSFDEPPFHTIGFIGTSSGRLFIINFMDTGCKLVAEKSLGVGKSILQIVQSSEHAIMAVATGSCLYFYSLESIIYMTLFADSFGRLEPIVSRENVMFVDTPCFDNLLPSIGCVDMKHYKIHSMKKNIAVSRMCFINSDNPDKPLMLVCGHTGGSLSVWYLRTTKDDNHINIPTYTELDVMPLTTRTELNDVCKFEGEINDIGMEPRSFTKRLVADLIASQRLHYDDPFVRATVMCCQEVPSKYINNIYKDHTILADDVFSINCKIQCDPDNGFFLLTAGSDGNVIISYFHLPKTFKSKSNHKMYPEQYEAHIERKASTSVKRKTEHSSDNEEESSSEPLWKCFNKVPVYTDDKDVYIYNRVDVPNPNGPIEEEQPNGGNV